MTTMRRWAVAGVLLGCAPAPAGESAAPAKAGADAREPAASAAPANAATGPGATAQAEAGAATDAPAGAAMAAVVAPAAAKVAAAPAPARLPLPGRSEAGGAQCTASEPITLGPHSMRRSRTVGPGYEVSNVQLARVGERLLAVWPAGEDSLRLQPLTDAGAREGAAQVLQAEGAPALFSLIPHGSEPLALLQIHRRCHRDNGARCIDSWWIGASGAPVGPKLEEFLGHNNNNLDEYAAITVAEGVLAGKTFDDTRQGYRYLGCKMAEIDGEPTPDYCPIVMPPPSLDRYALGAGRAVTVTPLLKIAEQAQEELFVPLADGELRGALHVSIDQQDRRHRVLRLVGREPVALAGVDDVEPRDDVEAVLDAHAGELRLLRRPGREPARLYRVRLDGSAIEPPAVVGAAGAPPFDDAVIGRLSAPGREIQFIRELATGQALGEALLLDTAVREVVRFDTMSTLLWDRGRWVAVHAVPARKAWTLVARTITCAG